MSHWFTRNLGDPILAAESLGRIEERFRAEHRRAGEPADWAVFVRHESEGRLHCEVRVYFTPAAASVARTAGAVACAEPAATGLGLLAGSPAAAPAPGAVEPPPGGSGAPTSGRAGSSAQDAPDLV